jgi:pyruvate formate lyase activating enzyme
VIDEHVELLAPVTEVQRFSLHDGPGIRTLVFLKGCPLSCDWCANPEGQAPSGELVWFSQRCTGCLDCVAACPEDAIARSSTVGVPEVDRALCDLCGRCVEACPTRARELLGRELSVEEVMREIRKDKAFYEASGGGVTFSGGEPVLHAPFLHAVLAAARRENIGTAIETCGHVPFAQLRTLIPVTQLFLYDVKHMDSDVHRRWTGLGNELILDNLRGLVAAGASVIVRTPVVPGFNADRRSISEIARFTAGLERVPRLELLPYHNYGEAKYARLDRKYRLHETRAPSLQLMQELGDAARSQGIAVQVGG